IPIAFSPILTRLYSPEDFGVLALFVSIVTIMSSIATARYEMAIVLPNSREESAKARLLAVIISFGISVILLLLFSIFYQSIRSWFGNLELGVYLCLAPLAVFFIGLFNALKYYHIRENRFTVLAESAVSTPVSAVIIQRFAGLPSAKSGGLLIGTVTS